MAVHIKLSVPPSCYNADLQSKFRPDIMMVREDRTQRTKELIIVELTCPFETRANLLKRHNTKVEKYKGLVTALEGKNHYTDIKLICVEVGSRGYIASSVNDLSPYITCDRHHPSIKKFWQTVGRESLYASLEIFRMKDIRPADME